MTCAIFRSGGQKIDGREKYNKSDLTGNEKVRENVVVLVLYLVRQYDVFGPSEHKTLFMPSSLSCVGATTRKIAQHLPSTTDT